MAPSVAAGDDHLRDLVNAVAEPLREMADAASADEHRQLLVEATVALEDLARHLRGRRSGSDVVLDELKAAYPAPVARNVLRSLAGIQEWARRLREHRVQSGFDIDYDRNSGYRLVRIDPDDVAAARWTMLNELRRRPGAALDRLRALFSENVGEVFNTAEVSYVGKIGSAPRRVRQLRTEEGLRIESHKDNPALGLREYLLVDPTPIPHSERSVSAATRAEVLERDGFLCVICGRGPESANRVWLEVDHITTVKQQGKNDRDNLRTICNLCHRARSREP